MKKMLAAVRPELTSEWSERNLPLTPDSVTHGSNKIVWWNGKCGHEWRASIKNRVISGSGYDSGLIEQEYPEIALPDFSKEVCEMIEFEKKLSCLTNIEKKANHSVLQTSIYYIRNSRGRRN